MKGNSRTSAAPVVWRGYLFAAIAVACLILSQAYLASYLAVNMRAGLFLWTLFLAAGAVTAVLAMSGAGPLYLLPVALLFAGWHHSYAHNQSVGAFIYYGLFAAAFAGVKYFYGMKQEADKPAQATGPAAGHGVWVTVGLLAAAAITLRPLLGSVFANIYILRDELTDFMPLRAIGACGNDICSSPFGNWLLLAIPAVFAALVAAFMKFAFPKLRLKPWQGLGLLVLAAFAAKFAVMSLSTYGTATLAKKIAAPVDCAYYNYALGIKDIFGFMRDYIGSYQLGSLGGSHLRGHPVMATVFYWVLIKFTAGNAVAVGVLYCLISAFAVVPFYMITRDLTGSAPAGYAAAGLYAATPFNTVLSSSGIDSIVLLAVLLAAAFYLRGVMRADRGMAALAGASFGAGCWLTFGLFPVAAAAPFLYMAAAGKKGGIRDFLFSAAAFTAGAAAVFALFEALTLFRYDYMASFAAARRIINDVSGREYILWWWANFIHWAAYASVAVTALWMYRYARAAKEGGGLDWFSAGSLTVIVMIFLACMGRSEQNRQWMFLAAFLVHPAILALGRQGRNGFEPDMKLYYCVLAAAFINSAVVEILIADTV